MAVTIVPAVPDVQSYTVLRAICVRGERVEPGAMVQLTRQQAQELSLAGKVSAQPVEPPAPRAARSRAAARSAD